MIFGLELIVSSFFNSSRKLSRIFPQSIKTKQEKLYEQTFFFLSTLSLSTSKKKNINFFEFLLYNFQRACIELINILYIVDLEMRMT